MAKALHPIKQPEKWKRRKIKCQKSHGGDLVKANESVTLDVKITKVEIVDKCLVLNSKVKIRDHQTAVQLDHKIIKREARTRLNNTI